MGIFDKRPEKPQVMPEERTIDVHLPNRPATETVTIRTSIHAEDEAWCATKLAKVLSRQKKLSKVLQLKLVDRLFLHRTIVCWNLTNDGQVIPLNPDMESNERYETIRALPQVEQDYLYAQLQAAQPRSLSKTHVAPAWQKAMQSRGNLREHRKEGQGYTSSWPFSCVCGGSSGSSSIRSWMLTPNAFAAFSNTPIDASR